MRDIDLLSEQKTVHPLATSLATLPKKAMKLYEVLAEELAHAIYTGTVKLGERLPSVRQASKNRGMSPSAVFEAYYLLEKRGLIQARERAGYFVAVGAKELPPQPENLTEEDSRCSMVNISETVFQILESTRMRDIVPLGSAFPRPQQYPWVGLARSMTSGLANMDPWSSVDDLLQGNEAMRRQIALRYLIGGLMCRPMTSLLRTAHWMP